MPSADSRESHSLCGSRGGTKAFPLEELWVPVDKEGSVASPGRVYMLVYSWGSVERQRLALSRKQVVAVKIGTLGETSKGGRKFHPMIKIISLNEV